MVTVVTKTIGPTGRDYTTFTLAEAAVESIATAEFGSTDLVANDGAIVFEADAGTYVEILNVDSTLVSDATRNATYRCADRSNRPVIGNGTQSTTVRMRDDFTRFDGIDSFDTSGGAFKLFDSQVGIIVENCEATSDGAGVYLNKSGANIGSAAAPCVVRNVVTKSRFGVNASGVDLFVDVINCTFLPGTTSPAGQTNYQFFATGSSACKLVNCIVLDSRADRQLAATATVTGSNNIGVLGGVSGQSFSTNGVGSEKTPTTSFSTPLGAGDFAVYMGSNGSLADVTGNDVWQQGVGPGTNSDVPTTDINGVARSGASCNPGAFEADGFVAPTVTTQTIGPTGRDYATFTLAEASLPAEDITFTNRAFVFEADAATYSESPFFSSSLTTDATRQVTYKPAAGSEHGGVPGAGVVINSSGLNFLRDDYMIFDGMEVNGSSSQVFNIQIVTGATLRNCILDAAVQNLVIAPGAVDLAVENCVLSSANYTIYPNGSSGTISVSVRNCTVTQGPASLQAIRIAQSGTATINAEFVNCLFLEGAGGVYNATGTVTVTGSNNFGSATNPWPASLQGSPYPITVSTAYDPGAGDFALYVSSTGQLLDSPHNDVIGGGVGPAANADVPTTDIVGRVRTGGTTNPGAFAVAQATRVIGKTIGPVGRDYASFTLAEAAVESIATAETGSTDLVAGNARIEFLADAATYTAGLSAVSSLVTDATRNVTYKNAAGSEHGGSAGAGVIIDTGAAGSSITLSDDFTVVDGLNLVTTTTYCAWIEGSGTVIRNCIASASNRGFLVYGGSAGAPNILENCVAGGGTGHAFLVLGGGPLSADAHARVVNCTGSSTGNDAFRTQATVSGTSATAEYINCLSISSPTHQAIGSFATATGSNNFGGSTNPFPAAVQGSPYPITPTTNTDPGPGHFAIYDADTGALVNVAANTVWQRGVGPSVNSDVPTTGIAGFPRSGATANPGAFAASTALAATTNPVARFFTYKRPSTQVFNHHRRISCVFPDDGPSGNGNTFAVGVAARGFISPISRDCVAFFVYYTTDGAGVQTSLRLEVARLLGSYSQDTIAEAQPIAVIEKQAVGEAIPAGFNFPGQSHTVAFRVQTFSGATTPESAAEYTAFIDGTAVTFDTFYQSSTQDGTTKVVTHPAPAVGTTQGRAESFFWYATADRVDSSGSENYILPQWSAWTQLAVDPDPLFDGDGETVGVLGEGTGTVNLSTAVEHVDWNISIQYELPRFDVPFASGHRYTSPRFANARRLITASATNVDKATMDLIVQFHAARKGIEDPFLFNFPVPATMASETYTVITVQFADQNGMVYRREAENTYSVQLNLLELL